MLFRSVGPAGRGVQFQDHDRQGPEDDQRRLFPAGQGGDQLEGLAPDAGHGPGPRRTDPDDPGLFPAILSK